MEWGRPCVTWPIGEDEAGLWEREVHARKAPGVVEVDGLRQEWGRSGVTLAGVGWGCERLCGSMLILFNGIKIHVMMHNLHFRLRQMLWNKPVHWGRS